MAWRARLGLTALGVVASGAIVGVLFAIGVIGGSSQAAAEATLRLEPAAQTVACGPDGATVRLFLDDLAFRANPDDATLPYGVGIFQVQLGYNPRVVRLVDASAVELNPALSTADPDGDGVTRAFSLSADIDDRAGDALLAGFSSVSGEPSAQSEVGPSPSGSPLLLMNVRFITVGQGSTALTLAATEGEHPAIAEPLVDDPLGQPYVPLAVQEATLSVEGGSCPEPPPLPTPEPTATPVPTPNPTATPEPPVIPEPVAGIPAHEAGRTDCAADWFAYRDAQSYFSVCYPGGWEVTTSPPQAYLGTVLAIHDPGVFSLSLYWERDGPAQRPAGTDPCVLVSYWRDVALESIAIASGDSPACVGDATDYGHPGPGGPIAYRGTFAEIPLSDGNGYVVVFLQRAEAAGPVLVAQIQDVLSSLLLVGAAP